MKTNIRISKTDNSHRWCNACEVDHENTKIETRYEITVGNTLICLCPECAAYLKAELPKA